MFIFFAENKYNNKKGVTKVTPYFINKISLP